VTNLTAMIIGTRDDLHVGSFESEGVWGYEISYGENHQPAVTHHHAFASKELAEQNAQELILRCQNWLSE